MTLTKTKSGAEQGPAAAAAGGLLLDPPDVTRILTLKQQHGWGTKRIAGELGISRRTVRRYLKLGGYKPYVRRKTSIKVRLPASPRAAARCWALPRGRRRAEVQRTTLRS
jgi:transposase